MSISEFWVRLLETDYFFHSAIEQDYFFQLKSEQGNFFRKNSTPPPPRISNGPCLRIFGQIRPEEDPGWYYVYCLCITNVLEYGVPRCANWINNWRLQLQNTCSLLQQEINCIDLTWNKTGYIDSGCIHDKWQKNRSMRGLFQLPRTSSSDRNATATNRIDASSYPELKYRDCLLFGLISQMWQSCFLIC